MDSAKLFCYAKLIGTLAEISWLTSVLVFLKGSKENNFSMWKKSIGFLIIAAICVIIAFGLIIVTEITK